MSLTLVPAASGRLEAADATTTGDVAPGLTALMVVLFLVVATVLLMRSMNNQLKKVPPTFDRPKAPDQADSGKPNADQAEVAGLTEARDGTDDDPAEDGGTASPSPH